MFRVGKWDEKNTGGETCGFIGVCVFWGGGGACIAKFVIKVTLTDE